MHPLENDFCLRRELIQEGMINFRLEETQYGRNVMRLSKLMWMETPGRHASDRSIPRSLRQEAGMGEPVSYM